MEKNKPLSGKGLAKPKVTSFTKETDFQQKREEARRIAQEKAKARTMAKKQQLSERLAAAAEELSSGVQQGSSAAEELMHSMQQIAAGAEETSSACEELKSNITQSEKNAQVNANLASDTIQRVKALGELATYTSREISFLVEGVEQAAKAAMQTSEIMNELEKKSIEIGKIVQSVVRIADQTNLLALNAAIEAARAGENGRGFAIVADEVRNLAETSEKSAGKIKDVVGEIQADVRKIVQEVTLVITTAQQEAEKGKSIAESLNKISSLTINFLQISNQTQQGIQEIFNYTKEFLKIAESVASAAQELASSSEESRKGTEQQAKAYSEMSSAAEELAQTSEELKNSTNIQKSAEDLASMAEELSANIEQALSASQELAKAIEQIQIASELQAKEVFTGTEIAEKLTSKNTQVEANAEQMQKQAQEVYKKIIELIKQVDGMIQSISISANKNFETSKMISALSEKIIFIDKIVESIVNVTIKTDMLAVSGSIEAARVGEQGKGFSVVSLDIRNLATESSQSAEQIKDLVRSLSKLVDMSALNVENSAKTAQAEVIKSKSSMEKLNQMETDMKTIDKAMEEMLLNTRQVKHANEETKKAIDDISAAAEQSLKSITQASAASEEQAKGLQELSEAIEEIAALADELQSE